MNASDEPPATVRIEESLAALERRLAIIEDYLGLTEVPRAERSAGPAEPAVLDRSLPGAGALEVAVGQSLFANVGVVVLAIGGALALSLPWHGLPRIVPSVVGWVLTVALFFAAAWLRLKLPQISRLCRAAGMALLFFATLRLCYFGAPSLWSPQSVPAATALSLVVAVNVGIGWRRKSILLTGLALLTGYAAALAVGTTWYVLGMVSAMAVVAGLAVRLRGWPWLVVIATSGAYATYLVWAIGNPLLGNRVEVVAGPLLSVLVLLVWMVWHAVAMTCRDEHHIERPVAQAGAVLNCGGYGLFVLHTLVRHPDLFVVANIGASLVLLGIAVMFWMREQSRIATFVYAMTGYAALNMALIKATAVPELFVWLAGQSLLVVATAIWFRSRFIVVANFLIFLIIVTAYMVLVGKESGISLIFGLVALTSARILNANKDRLELRTEMMRNSYLTSAFIVLPYAFYHIVPQAWVAVSWVGIALFYYLMNALTSARKYRWMGHNTLLLTIIYIVIVSIGRLTGTQRILSFLILGTVLLVVSLVFTAFRARQQRDRPVAGGDGGGGSSPPAG